MQLHWGNPFRRPNSGGVPLRQDSKICLMVALVVMAYVLCIQQGLESEDDKKKIYKNKSSRLAISYFRQGLSIIKAKIWSLKRFISVLNNILKMLNEENYCMSSSKIRLFQIGESGTKS